MMKRKWEKKKRKKSKAVLNKLALYKTASASNYQSYLLRLLCHHSLFMLQSEQQLGIIYYGAATVDFHSVINLSNTFSRNSFRRVFCTFVFNLVFYAFARSLSLSVLVSFAFAYGLQVKMLVALFQARAYVIIVVITIVITAPCFA